MTEQARENLPVRVRQLEAAKDELKLALMFAKVSSSAYRVGRLQHATDARSKAEAVQARAVAQLTEALDPEDEESADAVKSMLGEVQLALARLSFSTQPKVRRAS
ncbi:MAG TPA: hypothetical protein VLX58_01235 [Bryobacteraceae bacterium]|nr:hypothetical protein [Bryobacteraceae bacterium]